MLDIKFIREHYDLVRQGTESKGLTVNLGSLLALDEQRRGLLQEGEALKARRNQVSADIGKLKRDGKDAAAAIAEMDQVKDRIQSIDRELRDVETRLNELLLTVPNVPHPSVPVGRTPEDNQEIARWGELPKVDFPMKPHWELAEKLSLIDFTRGAKVTGAGFPFYVGKGALLERALINFFLDQAARSGYTEIAPPIVVNEESARGTGQIPDKEDLMYVVERDQLYMVPTAEVPVSNFHRDEVFAEGDLPVQYCAYTPVSGVRPGRMERTSGASIDSTSSTRLSS